MRRLGVVLALLLSSPALLLGAPQATSPTRPAAPILDIHKLGLGTVPLDGVWQFHLGDDLHWASPNYDDSEWEQVGTDKTWGAQTHPSHTGFAWYRRHLSITSSQAEKTKLAVLMPSVDDAYEIYWDGAKIGNLGTLPPNAVWYSSHRQAFTLPLSSVTETEGVLAVRVWKSPLTSADPDSLGGLRAPPLVGGATAVDAEVGRGDFTRSRQRFYDSTISSIFLLAGALALSQWTRNRKQWLYLWFGLWLVAEVGLFYLWLDWVIELFSYPVLFALEQLIYSLQDCSLFLLLLYLFDLQDNQRLRRWTLIAIGADFIFASIDGILLLLWAHAGLAMQWADAAVSIGWDIAELFVFVLVYQGIKRSLDLPRKLVAIMASLVYLYGLTRYLSKEGWRFTHWTLYEKLNRPLFQLAGSDVNVPTILQTVLLASVAYALLRFSIRERQKQTMIENELKSARELQQVLIPEAMPDVPGYDVASAYHSAQEVGGDFFQIISLPDKATLIVLGDVSGKGLKAAMNVALIVGTVRTLAEFDTDPASVLVGLNRRLVGRMQGGFTTALALKLDRFGQCKLANAGHLPPFLNDHEIAMDGSLPLGIISDADFGNQDFTLGDGDRLTLYTDGIPEARAKDGALYGFARMGELLSTRPSAELIARAARDFGQEDDITVVTIEPHPGNEPVYSEIIGLPPDLVRA